jgi:hypothetical protein
MPLDPCGRNGSPRSSAGTARSQKMTLAIGAACKSVSLAAAKVTAAGGRTVIWWYSSTSGLGRNRSSSSSRGWRAGSRWP